MAVNTADRADERLQFGAGLPLAAAQPAALPAPVAGALPSRPRSGRLAAVAPALARAFEGEQERGNLFLFVPVFMAAGVLVYFSAPHEPGFAPMLLCLALLAGLARAALGRPALRAVLLAALMTVAGMLAAKFETWRAGTRMLGAEITTSLTARVARIEHQASGRVRLTLDVVATERPALRYAPDRVRVTARSAPPGLLPGATVRGTVRLMPPSGPLRPQSYDFSFTSYFSGIGAVGFFLSAVEQVEDGPAPAPAERAAALVEAWRGAMAARIAGQIGGAEGEIAAALITGVRAGIPETVNEALRISGLYHVISISGLHMALVAGTLMVALRCGFALSPSFSTRRPVKKYAALAALLATAFYLFMSGGDIAAQRSFIMLAVMLLAVMFDRSALTMRNLAISAVIIILVAPHEVLGPSFQMSFAATAALVAAYAAWTQLRERRTSRKPPRHRAPVAAVLRLGGKYAAGMSMTSIVAGLATALFTAWHFQQVAPLGLVANLAAMPFVSVVVMPMAVLASLLMPLGLDGPPLQLMGWGIAAMNAIALWLAERSAFDATGAIPLGPVLVLSAALAVLTMAGGPLRWAAAPLLAAGLTLLALRDLPHALVSEDGQLVAMALPDGRVAVNRDRPRAFTMQNWQRALDAGEVLKPARTAGATATEPGEGFSCDPRLCVARHASGAVLAHAGDGEAAAAACAHAAVIVIDDATAANPCAQGSPALVLTKRDLARRGSAEITFHMTAFGPRAQARFAIAEPYRPWHEHRRFSREARGLAPYQRRQTPDPVSSGVSARPAALEP